MASRAAPIATPSAIQRPRLSVAAPIAVPIATPAAMPKPFGVLFCAKGSEVKPNDLRVIQELTAGANNGILALIQNVTAV